MPQRALRQCLGCRRNLVRAPANRCEACDRPRPSAAARGYDGAWEKLRADHLVVQPNCQRIEANGSACKFCGGTRPAHPHVDHIVPHRGDDRLRLDPGNLQTFCPSAHSSKTVTTDGGFGRG